MSPADPVVKSLTPESFFYRETGSLYVTRTALYASPGNRIGGRVELFVMEEVEGIDIDSEADLLLAEHAIRSIAQEPS